MAMQQLVTSSGDDDISIHGEMFSRTDILLQLEKIVGSKHFRNSKRYPSFLRFIVEQTVAGRTDLLKERTLGTDVFGRPSDYDTNADPIVRVTAGEIRKRIAQYYQDPGHEDELRVYLPVGSYVPQFLHAAHALPLEEHEATMEAEITTGFSVALPKEITNERPVPRKRGIRLWGALAIVALILGLAGGGLLVERSREQQSLRYFWDPILSSGQQVLIVLGVHSMGSDGEIASDEPATNPADVSPQNMLTSMTEWDMVPISDIASYSKMTDLLARQSRSYRLKGSAETSLEELRQGPVILIGGLDNIWTIRLTSSLRFYFSRNGQLSSAILDRQQPSKMLSFDNMQRVHADSRDYAIVANYFDPTIRQHVLIAAGIGKSGTQAAAEFVTSNEELKSWLASKSLSQNKNFELVLSTDTINGEPGPPSVIASTSW